MLKTATPGSTHAFSGDNTPGSQDSSSEPRSPPRTYLDVFNPPLDASVLAGTSPVSTPPVVSSGASLPIASPPRKGLSAANHVDVSCSPSNYPTSFAAYAVQSQESSGHGTPSSPGSFGGQSPSLVFRGVPHSPALNIRKTHSSASINKDLEEFHLGESLNASQGGMLHHQYHHHPHSPLLSKYSPRTNRRQWSLSELTHDDFLAVATTEEVRNPDLLALHHKSLHSALVTPPSPDSRRASIQELVVPVIPIEETTVSSSIPLYECPQDMLVPLLDRPKDMKGLLSHSSCDRSLHILKNVIGEKEFDEKLMKLWTETGRKEVSDAEWLWRTKSIILRGGGRDATREWKLWGDFCAMVGFDEEDESIDQVEEKRPGTPVETMEKIGEEEEEAENGVSKA